MTGFSGACMGSSTVTEGSVASGPMLLSDASPVEIVPTADAVSTGLSEPGPTDAGVADESRISGVEASVMNGAELTGAGVATVLRSTSCFAATGVTGTTPLYQSLLPGAGSVSTNGRRETARAGDVAAGRVAFFCSYF